MNLTREWVVAGFQGSLSWIFGRNPCIIILNLMVYKDRRRNEGKKGSNHVFFDCDVDGKPSAFHLMLD
jgi:hypothetical protein